VMKHEGAHGRSGIEHMERAGFEMEIDVHKYARCREDCDAGVKTWDDCVKTEGCGLRDGLADCLKPSLSDINKAGHFPTNGDAVRFH